MSQIELSEEILETGGSDTIDIIDPGESVAVEDVTTVVEIDDKPDSVIELGTPGGIGPAGPEGPEGPPGPQGPPGGGSAGLDLTYAFNQQVPASQWIIVHNFGKQPSVEVVDSAGTTVYGDVVHDSIYQLTVNFTAPFAGTAYLN